MFYETRANIDFAAYADDNASHTYHSRIENVLDNLQGALEKYVSLIFNKLLGRKCRKMSPFNKL